jgi:CheY-like chemotaxis protein
MSQAACILVIEDDNDIRTSIEEVLKDEGYGVLSATNGREALTLLETMRPKPNLILLDIMMPVMDGFQFREEQLKDDELAQVPTVILSADGHLPIKAAKANTHFFLKKPVDLDELFDLVRKFCKSADGADFS